MTKDPAPLEVVNDINGDLVNFFRVAKFHHDALIDEVLSMPNSREVFDECLASPGQTDIIRAARWFYLNKNSFGGMGKNFGISKKSGGPAMGSRERRGEALQLLHKRFDKVCIENLDWRDVLKKYDTSGSLFYLDPPYTAGHQYTLPWTDEDHAELAEAVRSLTGRWILSYDDSKKVRKLYKGCKFTTFQRANGIGTIHRSHKKQFNELLVMPK